jgi:ATPase subunit of ABC transporter with duplicated ATPase domains
VLGLNGSGKSSLLRILAGTDKSFNGQTVLSPGHTIGMLEQEPALDETKTVREIVEEGAQEAVDALHEFNLINDKFAEPMSDDEMNKLIERQGKVQEKLDMLDAWNLDSLKWRWTPGVPRVHRQGCPVEKKAGGLMQITSEKTGHTPPG